MADSEIPQVQYKDIIHQDWGNKVREVVHDTLVGHRHDGVLSRKVRASDLDGHDKTLHDALDLNADSVDGLHAPNTVANLLTNHDKALHDALAITPGAHKTSHQDNGSDEISVAGLSGLLADSQTPLLHSTDKHDSAVLDTTAKLLAQNIRQTRNRVAGITPTFDTFDTNPSNPERITDGDFTTETGEGVKSISASGTIGNTKFDMGAVYPVLVCVWANFHRASGDGTIGICVDHSNDGSSWISASLNISGGKSVDNYTVCMTTFVYARYFRVRAYTVTAPTSASVFHVKFAEVMAIDLGF